MTSDPVSASSPVTLREITTSNVRLIMELEVDSNQREFVASNARSIAEAHFPATAEGSDVDGLVARLVREPRTIEILEPAPDAWFRAIYAGETPVGFVMLSMDPDQSEYYVWRIMIAGRYQEWGFGSRAMRQVIDHVRTLPNARELSTSHRQGNEGAARFFTSLGFRYTGEEVVPGDLLMKLDLDQPAGNPVS